MKLTASATLKSQPVTPGKKVSRFPNFFLNNLYRMESHDAQQDCHPAGQSL